MKFRVSGVGSSSVFQALSGQCERVTDDEAYELRALGPEPKGELRTVSVEPQPKPATTNKKKTKTKKHNRRNKK